MNNKMNSFKGDNVISFPLAMKMSPGIYTIEVNDGKDTPTKKFMNQ